MGKFKARYVVIPLLLIAVGGGIFAGVKVRESKKYVKVATVESANAEFSSYMADMSGETYYGKLQKGSLVNVKLDPELKLDKINVKKGDTVKKGDVLISYDTHSLEDSVQDAELQVKTITNEITIIENEIDVLTRLQPSENAPQSDDNEEEEQSEPETDSDDKKETPDKPRSKFDAVITEKTMPLAGSGTQEDPLIYMAGVNTVVSKDLIKAFSEAPEPMFAAFYVCSEDDAQLFARVIDSSKIGSDVSDFPVSDGVTITPDGMISFSGSKFDFATFVTASAPSQGGGTEFTLPEGFEMPAEMPQIDETTDTDQAPYELSLNDNYMYSRQQLKDMISERQKQKETLNLQKKQAELNAKTMRYRAQTGGEVSPIDGTVTFVAKDIYHLSDSGAYITVTNDNGMSVTADIGEFSLGNIALNDTVKIKNYETGAEISGTVTDISDEPAAQGSLEDSAAGGMESQYKFTVTLSDTIELSEDGEVQISKPQEFDKDKTFYFSSALVRSEGGRYYVMAANDDNVLEKRYVTIGNIQYEMMQIVDGLTAEDRIAFPYGKAVEGAPTVDATFEEMYYNFGLLY